MPHKPTHPKPLSIHESEESALRHFKKVDPRLYAASLPFTGSVAAHVHPKRTNRALFESLVSSIVSQQLSTKAAQTIYARLRTALGGIVTAHALRTAEPEVLRDAGLSAAKLRALTELAEAVDTGHLNLLALKRVSPEEAVRELSALRGIGPWTAEMFLIFALGATDIFSPGDLALARSLEKLHGLPKNTSRKDLARIAAIWSPYRSYASLVLWKLYDPE